ncbi:MAG TPA: GAF domain-containing protein, partial [Candidatus Polarisedimenticolaceae bacterium]|nr:GAF domain-containing protein [Candidatus Polarisedimenticolaceae bacterium]
YMGGTTSAYLKSIRQRLSEANEGLSSKNEQLRATVMAHELAQTEQDVAIERLKESEDRYRRLLERIQDGVAIIQDGKLAYSNLVFATMVGDTPEGLVGADFRELVPPEDRRDLSDRYRRWQEAQSVSGVLESRLLTRSGAIVLVSLRAGSVEYRGRPAVIATIRDITRERRMEEDIKAHAERLAAINEIANAVNLSLTIEDIFSVAAEETRRLVPFDRLTIALLEEGGPSLEVVAVGPGARRQRAAVTQAEATWAFRRPTSWCQGEEPPPPHLQDLLAHRGILSVATVPLLSKDRVVGSMNLGRFKAQPFSAADLAVVEPVARHIAIALDNAQLLEAVRRRSSEFESLLEIGNGILERLELNEILPQVTRSVNRMMGTHFCALLLRSGDRLLVAAEEGLEPEVVEAFGTLRVGDSLSGWVAQEGRPLAVADMRDDPRLKLADAVTRFGYVSYLCVPLMRGPEVLGTLEVVTKEPRRFSAEEQERMAAFAAQAAVAIDNARLLRETRRHLSEMAEANRRLAELDQLRQQYLRNVSHEFRTPLTVIKGYAEYLMDAGAADDRSLRDVMRILVESCDRVIDMVDTLIEVSRIEQGTAQQALQVQALDLREVATTSVDPLKPTAAKKGVNVTFDFPLEPLGLQGDGGLLHHVVRKLVDNAVKYSSHGGQVVVRGRPQGEELELQVEDFGIGIAEEHLPRIFEKFYMVDGGIARRSGGTGVGLYLVREIVRLHRGSVHVRSHPGQGSVFSVRLPRTFKGERPRQQTASA